MIIVPNQFFGIGDVIWEQTLVRSLAGNNKILWPVMPQFVEGLNRAYPDDMTFIDYNLLKLDYDRKDHYVAGDMSVLPLRWADHLLKVPYSDCMKSKYMMYGMDWEMWDDNAMWFQDSNKENELFQILGCEPRCYQLVNVNFGSDSVHKINIPTHNMLPVVEMRTIPGFSLFDWTKVICNAAEIHTVSTSIIYMLEQLNILAKEVHLYPRKPHEHDFRNIEYIIKRHKYIKHL